MQVASKSLVPKRASEEQVVAYMAERHPNLCTSFAHCEVWVKTLLSEFASIFQSHTGGRKSFAAAVYVFWREAQDLNYIRALAPPQSGEDGLVDQLNSLALDR